MENGVKILQLIKAIGAGRVIIILFLFAAIAIGGGYFWGSSSTSQRLEFQNDNSAQANLITVSGNSGASGAEREVCDTGSFPENSVRWSVKEYELREDGFYDPRSSSGFISPDIWYKDQVPMNFRSIELSYQLISRSKNGEPPPFILSLGQQPRIFRFYAPEKTSQIAGFERVDINDPNLGLKREPPNDLSAPIKEGTPVEIALRSLIRKANEASYTINLSYLSALTGKSVEDSFVYNVTLPDPNPDGGLSKIKFGIGTFKGYGLKPASYKICY